MRPGTAFGSNVRMDSDCSWLGVLSWRGIRISRCPKSCNILENPRSSVGCPAENSRSNDEPRCMLSLCQLAMLTCRSPTHCVGDCVRERVRGRNSSDSIAGNAARRTRFGAAAGLTRKQRAERRRRSATAVRGLAVRLHCHDRGGRNRAGSFRRSLGNSEMDRPGIGIHLDRVLSGSPQVARDRFCFGIARPLCWGLAPLSLHGHGSPTTWRMAPPRTVVRRGFAGSCVTPWAFARAGDSASEAMTHRESRPASCSI